MNLEKKLKRGTGHTTSTSIFAALTISLVLTGCSNPTRTRIEAKDVHVATPELRMAYSFDDKETALPHTGHAVEFRVSNARGSGTQSLSAGDPSIKLNSTIFTAPQQLTYDFDFTFGDISWRWRKFFRENKFGIEVAAGPGLASFNLQASSPAQSASQRFENMGVRASVGPIFRFTPSSSIQANFLMFYSPLVLSGIHDAQRYELVYAQAFQDNFRLRAGYVKWHIVGYNDFQSDFVVDYAGPLLALDLEF